MFYSQPFEIKCFKSPLKSRELKTEGGIRVGCGHSSVGALLGRPSAGGDLLLSSLLFRLTG